MSYVVISPTARTLSTAVIIIPYSSASFPLHWDDSYSRG